MWILLIISWITWSGWIKERRELNTLCSKVTFTHEKEPPVWYILCDRCFLLLLCVTRHTRFKWICVFIFEFAKTMFCESLMRRRRRVWLEGCQVINCRDFHRKNALCVFYWRITTNHIDIEQRVVRNLCRSWPGCCFYVSAPLSYHALIL